jgi:hypothetical protein
VDVGLIDDIRTGSFVPSAGGAVSSGGCSTSIADTAARVAGGAELLEAVREFLDQVGRRTPDELGVLIHEEPSPTGSREGDVLLAGIAEHLAVTHGLPCPGWTQEPERFLDRFWFVSAVPGFRAISLAQSPMALKRRGILWPARSLARI